MHRRVNVSPGSVRFKIKVRAFATHPRNNLGLIETPLAKSSCEKWNWNHDRFVVSDKPVTECVSPICLQPSRNRGIFFSDNTDAFNACS